ncbi:MAG: hypothetical protein KTR15_04325 [Phycisphaeraceae bacterium]|nr:hypothetical protein [Phycisphaeraceae bacterium]
MIITAKPLRRARARPLRLSFTPMTGADVPHDDADPMHPLTGLAVSLVMPWRACRRAWREAGVYHSLLYHVAGIFLFFAGLIVVDAVFWYGDFIEELAYIGPGELPIMLVLVAVWLIVIELCYLLTAWWTSCWGAGAERYSHGVGRSLSRWYQLTPFHAAWTLALIVAIDIVDNLQWNDSYYDYDTLGYQLRELFYSIVWLSIFLLYCGIGGWFTLRALVVPRSSEVYRPKSRWPALCETCGYAIVGLTGEQTCPECGRPAETSLNTPRGTQEHGTLAKMRMALFNPAALGDTLQVHTRTPGYAKALAITAITLLLTGPLGVGYVFIVSQVIVGDDWLDGVFDFLQVFLIGGLFSGLSASFAGVIIVLGAGSLVGLADRVFGKRNLLPAACQAACYASGYVLFIAALMYGFTTIIVLLVDQYFDQMGYYWLEEILPLAWFGVFLLLTLPYFVIVGRIVRNMRYANA